MVQLNLLDAGIEAPSLESHLEGLVRLWQRRTTAVAPLHQAARITGVRFAGLMGAALTPRERQRVTDYFGGVVRRIIMKGTDPESHLLRQRLIATAVEQDLLLAGWKAERARAEAHRVAGLSALEGAA